MTAQNSYELHAPCQNCGARFAMIYPRNGQDVARCADCGTYQYCVPRKESGKPQRRVRTREDLAPGQATRIMARDGGRCVLCGRYPPLVNLHIDHIFSVDECKAAGLEDTFTYADDNLWTLCEEHNLGKGKLPWPLPLIAALWLRRQG